MRPTHLAFSAILVATLGLAPAATGPQQSVKAGARAQSADDKALAELNAAFMQAFAKADDQAIAGLFTEDAEALDSEGEGIQGKEAIRSHYAERFAESPGDTLESRIESIKTIAPGIARVTGTTSLKPADDSTPSTGKYVAIEVKQDGQWRIASIRDLTETELTPADHLKELEWLIGDWVQEGDDAVVTTSISWTDNKSFLLRTFEVKVAGKPALSGSQRIGWDPLTKQIKSWVFDDQGGYGDGLWMRSGDQWVIKATGVRSDGRVATATQVLTYVSDNMMRWKSIDRTRGDAITTDIEEVTLVKKPPQPK